MQGKVASLFSAGKVYESGDDRRIGARFVNVEQRCFVEDKRTSRDRYRGEATETLTG